MERSMSLEDFLQQRLDAARVAIFDLLQAIQAVSEFQTIVIYRWIPDDKLCIEGLAEATAGSAESRALRLGETRVIQGTLEEDVIALRTYVIVPDTASDSHYRDRGAASGTGAFMGFPLVRSGGEIYGVLSAYDSTPRPVSKSVISTAKAIARAAAAELEVSAAIEAVLDGKADPWQALQALGSVANAAFRQAEPGESEAVANATKIIAAAYGFDLKSPPQRVPSESVDLTAEDAEPAPNSWPAEVDDVVGRADRLLPSLPGARIEVHPDSGSVVDVDSRTLERIVANLLLNAWRSSPPGTPISVASLAEGDWVEIAVEDKSGLVPVESLARRMHPAGSRRIGLPVAQALVEEAGGRMSQLPTEDGRRYVVRLPVLKNDGSMENGPGGPGRSVRGA
jgi:hypothetical protein